MSPALAGVGHDAVAGFLSYGPITCSPPTATLSWRFDSQVSPPAGHQLRGRLATTPTGLPPASPSQLDRTHLTSPPQAPRANAICERMIGTLRRELLDRLLIVNEHHLRRILATYLHHFNTARPHRTLGQLAPIQAEPHPPQAINLANYQVRRRSIVDGLISEYQLAA
jgi:hypothetical protein